ncbi:MFS transporter [Kytococcus schroeteri]|uniref:MFS transporter n=1 Tax=Kytococcus schroeteri TaxID=138300 RepID=UPI0015DEE064|nr:MFS transporter [Kytococcus schroeteri]
MLVLAAGTNSATMLSTLLAALVVVDAVVTPACGWVADRFNRRSVMILADVGAAAAYGVMFLVAPEPWWVFGCALVATVFESLYFPASSASVPRVLEGENLGGIFAAFGQARTLAGMLGPAVVAGLVLVASAKWAFLVNAASFLVSAVVVLTIRRAFGPDAGDPGSESDEPSRPDGSVLGVLRRHPVLLVFMGVWATTQLGTGALWVALPVLAGQLGDQSMMYAAMNSFSVLISFLGLTLFTRVSRRRSAGPLLVVGLAGQAVGLFVLGLGAFLASTAAGLIAVGLTFIALTIHRLAQAFTGATSYELLADAVPDGARGRANSWVDFATVGSFGLGVWTAGPAVDLLGLGTALLAATVLVVIGTYLGRRLAVEAQSAAVARSARGR